MMSEGKVGWLKRMTVRHLLTGVLAVQVVAVVVVILIERAARRAEWEGVSYKYRPDGLWTDAQAKPIRNPMIHEGRAVKLQPNEPVIGLEIAGKARAYQLSALEMPTDHLVVDRIGSTPVLVSYCNLSHCVRVYTDPDDSRLLDVEVAGLFNGEMVIKVGGSLYFQSSGEPVEPRRHPAPLPYQILTPTITTWKNWTRLHPGTDVYAGRPESLPN